MRNHQERFNQAYVQNVETAPLTHPQGNIDEAGCPPLIAALGLAQRGAKESEEMKMQQPSQSSPVPSADSPTVVAQWGERAPKGARQVFARIIKEGANVPLFLSQTLVNTLRDVGYNNTTSAVCEYVDNSIQAGASEVRIYFNQRGKKNDQKIDVLILDNGKGMAPNVLRAVTAFGGSMNYDDRQGIGRYGMGMKTAALSMGKLVEIYSWTEPKAFYCMSLDVEAVGDDRSNVVNLPEPEFADALPAEVRAVLTSTMTFPSDAAAQELLTSNPDDLTTRLGAAGTLIYIPDCDRLMYRRSKSLTEHATKEFARIYRRQLGKGLRIFVNNRCLEPFDPTYTMEGARHTKVPEIGSSKSSLVRVWNVDIPLEEGGAVSKQVTIRLFRLPIEVWDLLARKILKNDLHVFDGDHISFVRSNREIHKGHVSSIVGKFGTRDHWWRLEIEFPAELDEAFGVSFNKQGVRPKGYVSETIQQIIWEDLRLVRESIERHWAQRAVESAGPKLTEAEKRANEAEALMATLLPKPAPKTEEEARVLEEGLRTLAVTLKREGESDEQAYDRIKESRFVTVTKHDPDAPFYRVDFPLGKVILTLNSAHPFHEKLYQPLAQLSKTVSQPDAMSSPDPNESGDVSAEPVVADSAITGVASEALLSLQLLLLSLGRTQSTMLHQDHERQKVFDQLRRQWSLNLEVMLTHI
jgi:hypothetical protein